jgi:iron(III) transport system substrate-binding protein
MYNSNIETLKRKGAPIDYVPVQPVVARPQGIGVARNAPHPNAAILFAEFVLSPTGSNCSNRWDAFRRARRSRASSTGFHSS